MTSLGRKTTLERKKEIPSETSTSTTSKILSKLFRREEDVSKLLRSWEERRGIDVENESLRHLFKPTSYFQFPENHENSPHINLPSVSKWSALRGFTFTVWIRIPFVSFSHEAFVGSLFDFHSKGSGGCGAMLHYDKQLRLDYRCSLMHTSESSHSVDFFIKDDEWHMITISHSLPYLHKPRLRVYVDGVSRCDKEIPYPTLKQERDIMNQCTAGHGLPPHTRLAALTLYGGVLPASAVRSLYGVGPSTHNTWPISVPVPILRPWELLMTPALESQDLPSSRESLNGSSTTPLSAKKRRNDSETKLRRAAHSSRDVFVVYSLNPSVEKNIVSYRPVGFTKRVRRSGQVTDVRIMCKTSNEDAISTQLCGDIKSVIEKESTHAALSRLGGIERILDHFMEHENPSLTIRLLRLFMFSGLSVR